MRYLAIACAVLLLWPVLATAQEPPPRGPEDGPRWRGGDWEPGHGPPPRGEAREMLEQVMLARLSEELGLSDEETVLLVRRYGAFRERLADLRRQRAALSRELREAVKDDAPTARLEGLLGQLREVDEGVAAARLGIFDEMREGLGSAQQAQLYLFIVEFEQKLAGWVAQTRRRGARPPFMGEGPPGDPDAPRRLMRPRGEMRPDGPRREGQPRPNRWGDDPPPPPVE